MVQQGPFVSYAREDRNFVLKLHDLLLDKGIEIWGDWKLPPITEWMRDVRSAIDAAPAVIFAISPDSIASLVCNDELAHAVAQNKKIIPIVCRETDANTVPESIRKLNWIFARDRDDIGKSIDQLIEAITVDLASMRQGARLLVRAGEWEGKGRDRSFLLRGEDLREFEEWLGHADGTARARPTALQTQYVLASRKAETHRQRFTLIAVSTALLVTAVLAVYALIQSQIARRQRDTALSRLLAARAARNVNDPVKNLDVALLQGVLAGQLQSTAEARESLFNALIATNRIQRFVGTPDTLVGVAVSPDGRTIATGHFHGQIILWDAKTLAPRLTLEGEKQVVKGLAFSPDGGTLAAGSGNQITLWNTASGTRQRVLSQGEGTVTCLAWQPGGTTLVSGIGPNLVFWNAATGGVEAAVAAHRALRTLVVSPDGKTIASAGDRERGIKLWNAVTHVPRAVLDGHEGALRALAFSADGKLLASGGADSAIIVWDAASGRQRLKLEDQTDAVNALAFRPDGTELLAATDNFAISTWDLTGGKQLALLLGHKNSVIGLAFSPDGQTLYSIPFGDELIVWNYGKPLQRAYFRGHRGDVNAVAASPDGTLIASAGEDGTVRLWDTRKARERATLRGHRGAVKTVAFSSDGRRLASGGDDDPRIIVWDVASGQPVKELECAGDVERLAYSPDGRYLASTNESSDSIVLWNTSTGEQETELTAEGSGAKSLAFSHDGRLLVSGGGDGALRLWDVSTRKEAVAPKDASGAVVQAAISPDGRMVASSASMSDAVLLWEAHGSAPAANMNSNSQGAEASIAFSPDGKTFAYTSGELRFDTVLWDVIHRRQIAVLTEAPGTILSMAFMPDGKHIVTGQASGLVVVWDVNLDAWPARACEIAHRNLTREEWNRFVGEELPYRSVCPDLPMPRN